LVFPGLFSTITSLSTVDPTTGLHKFRAYSKIRILATFWVDLCLALVSRVSLKN